MEQLYYIWAKNKGYVGNCVLFWGKNRSGYTCDLSKAGKYTEEDAKDICNGCYNEKIPLRTQDVEKIAILMADSQNVYDLEKPLTEEAA